MVDDTGSACLCPRCIPRRCGLCAGFCGGGMAGMGACDVSPCGEPAYLRVQWVGPSRSVQEATLCRVHVRELWDRMKGLLAAGMGRWVNWPVIREDGGYGR